MPEPASAFSKVEFLISAGVTGGLPSEDLPELAFAGRSNVGKSSAINALARRKRLAFVSKTPGRTQTINLFRLAGGGILADLPGYGYAKVPEALRRHWEATLSAYLQTRASLCGLALVMEFIGDENGDPAPRISDLKMEKDEAEETFRQSVQNLKRIVHSGRVHGDYSTFNILWHNGEAVVIDFPQVMEFKNNPNAHAFLERDVRSLCKSFMKQGVIADEVKVLREIRAR